MKKVLLVFTLVVLFGCEETSDPALEDLLSMEDSSVEGMAVSAQRIDELKENIENYREIVNRKVQDHGQLGVYYKLLAGAYMTEKMYGPALDTLREAIKIFPQNSNLHYRAALAAAHMGKASMVPSEREIYFALCEGHYLQAIHLHQQFGEALYGISILYIFELNQPAKATPYVERLMALEKNNMEVLFLRARLYVFSGEIEKAIEIYSHLVSNSKNEEQILQAKRNREALIQGFDYD